MILTIPPSLSTEHTDLRTKLLVAMRVEEEELYPATLVVGEYLRSRLSEASRTPRSRAGGRA